jgi:hypothetical protein
MANILYELSPLLGAIEGKGTFGNVLGKADSLKLAKDAADKDEADKKAAFDKIASNGGRNAPQPGPQSGMRKGGAVKTYAKGGSVKSSASKRGDGIAQKGKTRGKIC